MRPVALLAMQLAGVAAGIRLPDRDSLFTAVDPAVAVAHTEIGAARHEVVGSPPDHYGPLVIDAAGAQLLAGMRNGVLRLRLDNMTVLERWTWQPSDKDASLCHMKGRSDFECGNFVRSIARAPDGRLLVCGTHAFSPKCAWLMADRLSASDKLFDADTAPSTVVDGVGAVPYDPNATSAGVMTTDGQFIAGTPVDFTGSSSAVLRFWPQDNLLQTERNDAAWLNDASFVAAFEIGNFVYVLFMETAAEKCDGRRVARVGRVCRNDVGGDMFMAGTWLTFTKATVSCHRHYPKLTHATLSQDHKTVAAVFTSDSDAIAGSVACVYKVDDLRKVFAGDYLYQVAAGGPWATHDNPIKYFDCGVRSPTSQRPGASVRKEADAQKYQLVDGTWSPIGGQPVHIAPLVRYVRVLVDNVRTKAGQSMVLFAVSDVGLVDKLVVNEDVSSSCLVEVLQALAGDSAELVTDAVINSPAATVFLSTESRLLAVPVHYCSRRADRSKCESSPDPYCGWDSQLQRCTTAPGGVPSRHWWTKSSQTKCDAGLGDIVDGGFSDWSEWQPCPHVDTATGDGPTNATNGCMCRVRRCDSPRPSAGGRPCAGPTVAVSKCRRDGRWTEWSAWSSCSSTCASPSAVRSRSRSCTNPSPAHGGSPCVGAESQEDSCVALPECPPVLPDPIDGGWSPWAAWTACSRPCGGGTRTRERSCSSPAPRHGGALCSGCNEQHDQCNTDPCPQVRRWSDWTPWMAVANSTGATDGGRQSVSLTRYKFACLANIDHPSLLTVSQPRSEQKRCRKGANDCLEAGFAPVDGRWSAWSGWSQCSEQCGDGGRQRRARRCDSPAPANGGLYCDGHAAETRSCNRLPCVAQWTCWSELTPCSATCGRGARERVRTCDRHPLQAACEGRSSQVVACYEGPCPDDDGYESWSSWSECDTERRLRTRLRSCIDLQLCGGTPAQADYEHCDPLAAGLGGTQLTAPVRGEAWRLHEKMIFACSIAFAVGLIVAAAAICCAFKIANCKSRKNRSGRQSSSPAGTQSSLPATLYTPVPLNGSNKSAVNLYTPPPDEPTVFANNYCRPAGSNPASSLLGAGGNGTAGGCGSSGDEEMDLMERRSTPSSVAPSAAASSRLTRATCNGSAPPTGASYVRLPAGRPTAGAVSPLDQLLAVVRQNGLAGSNECNATAGTRHLSRLNVAGPQHDEPAAGGATLRRAVRASMHSKDFL